MYVVIFPNCTEFVNKENIINRGIIMFWIKEEKLSTFMEHYTQALTLAPTHKSKNLNDLHSIHSKILAPFVVYDFLLLYGKLLNFTTSEKASVNYLDERRSIISNIEFKSILKCSQKITNTIRTVKFISHYFVKAPTKREKLPTNIMHSVQVSIVFSTNEQNKLLLVAFLL